jgi:hypothetical protein
MAATPRLALTGEGEGSADDAEAPAQTSNGLISDTGDDRGAQLPEAAAQKQPTGLAGEAEPDARPAPRPRRDYNYLAAMREALARLESDRAGLDVGEHTQPGGGAGDTDRPT